MIILGNQSETVGEDVVAVNVVVPELANSHCLPCLPLVHWRLTPSLALPLPVNQETMVCVGLLPHPYLLLECSIVLALWVVGVVDASHAVRMPLLDQPVHPLPLIPTHLLLKPRLMLHR